MKPPDLSDAELLVREGVEAAEAGDRARAVDLLRLALTLDQENVTGWLWLSGVVEDPADRAFCLQQVLSLDPGNEQARQGLASLQERVQERVPEEVQARGRRPVQEVPQGQDLPGKQVPPQQQVLLPGTRAIPAVAAAIVRHAEALVEFIAGGGVRQAGFELLGGLRLFPRSEFALIAVLGVVLLALILSDSLAGAEGLPAALSLLRLLLGLAYVLFVPGYALQAALFPRRADPSPGSGQGLDGPERLALSFGLSVALATVLALILDQLPWGIRLGPIVAAEGLAIILLSEVALLRRWRLPVKERPALALKLDLKDWWAAQDRAGRVLYGMLGGALLVALIAAAAMVLAPTPGEHFTEFYILGSEGLAENYPREAAPGEPLSVTAGVANHEGTAAQYRIEVLADGQLLGETAKITLWDGQVWEAQLIFALPGAGEDQQIEFLLYRDGRPEPYRRLRLWIDIVEVPGGGAD